MNLDRNAKVVLIVQARLSSSRLPGKVLLDLGGKPVLAWMVDRCRRAKQVDEVVVATTVDPRDEPIVRLCQERAWSFFRGSEFDVLDRFYQAARCFQAGVIVRVTADCPLIDPRCIDQVVEEFFASGADFAANRLPPPWSRTYPIGLDTEVCSFAGLERAWKEASRKFEREHVMSYFYDQEGRFKLRVLNHDPDYGHYRWTLDTPEDLVFLREVVRRFAPRVDFTWEEVLALVQREPALSAINSSVQHKTGLDVDQRME